MRTMLGLLAVSFVLMSAAPAGAQQKATYITREEVETVNATPGGDRNIRVVDIGYENFAVGIVRRGRTVNGREVNRAPSASLTPGEACGRKMDEAPAGGRAAGITHDAQTEGYYIVSGGGTMYTDGYIVNGRRYPLADLNGPTCIGTAFDVTERAVKQGDIIIIPAGVVHGWIDIPDHVHYLTFRPSPRILTPGWVHPALQGR